MFSNELSGFDENTVSVHLLLSGWERDFMRVFPGLPLVVGGQSGRGGCGQEGESLEFHDADLGVSFVICVNMCVLQN